MYRLSYSHVNGLPDDLGKEKIDSVRLINLKSGQLLGVRTGNELIGFKYVDEPDKWKFLWREKIFSQADDGSVENYPWWASAVDPSDGDVIITRQSTGLSIYQATISGLQFLSRDSTFHDVFGWSNDKNLLLAGRFYSDKRLFGLISRDSKQKPKFHVFKRFDAASKDEPQIWALNNLNLPSAFASEQTEFLLAHNGKDHENMAIILRTHKGLEFYLFSNDYSIAQIMATSQMKKLQQPDHLFFAKLADNEQNILHLNASGLFVFQYEPKRKDFVAISFSSSFSKNSGWLPEHSDSLQIVDINSDNLDDLLFSGPNGITALTFDAKKKTWLSILDTSNLGKDEKYSTLVGIIDENLSKSQIPMVFIQDSQKKLSFGTFTKTSEKIDENKDKTKISTKIEAPLKWIDEELSKFQKISGKKDGTPAETTRFEVQNKPALRWSEQFDTSFMKHAVDTASGQVRFKIPLIDFAVAAGPQIELFASYDSQNTASGLFGTGWSTSLGQDFITVDYDGSIFPEDHKYFLVHQGDVIPLQAVQFGYEIVFAGLGNAEVRFNPKKQSWKIKTTSRTAMYGECELVKNLNAVQWSLAWKNWRGSGREVDQLQPLAVAWHLNELKLNNGGKSIFYRYEGESTSIGSKKVTTAKRIVEIYDNLATSVKFEYSGKFLYEYEYYQGQIDLDENINFPVGLANNVYLSKIEVTTPTFYQSLKFDFMVSEKKRYLTGISQIINRMNHEILFQFQYELLGQNQVLTKTTLPLGQTVSYKHELAAPHSIVKEEIRHPTSGVYKISFAAKYILQAEVVLASPRNEFEVIVKVFDQTFSKVIERLSTGLKPMIVKKEELSFQLKSFDDYFAVLLNTEEDQEVFLFHFDGQKWSTTPERHVFSQNALIRFDEEMMIVSDPEALGLQVIKWLPKGGWIAKCFESRIFLAMAMHKKLIVGADGFDGMNLHLIRRDEQGEISINVIESDVKFPDVVTTNRKFAAMFDIFDETERDFLNPILEQSLQVHNNAILLHAFDLQDGKLSSNFQLVLLDENHKVASVNSETLQLGNISDLKQVVELNGSKFTTGYVFEGGKYMLKIKEISGKIVEDIEKIVDKGKKAEAIKNLLKRQNEDNDWIKRFKTNILFDWKKHLVTLSRTGVSCGDDVIFTIGNGLQQRKASPMSVKLGSHFVLKASDESQTKIKLYRAIKIEIVTEKRKIGEFMKELLLHEANHLVNSYPAYIAFQSSEKSVTLLTFEDPETLGKEIVFHDETLLPESNLVNLLTVSNALESEGEHSNTRELIVRPVVNFLPTEKQRHVILQTLSDGVEERKTGFERTQEFNFDEKVFIEKVAVIPGADRKISGWYEAERIIISGLESSTSSEKWFDADGKEVQPPFKETTEEPEKDKNSEEEKSDGLLWDQNGEWLISDFTPFSLKSDMVAYYGFESYERNALSNDKFAPRFKFRENHVKRDGFSFTGQNCLELDGSRKDEFVAEFQPEKQRGTYLASAWVRSDVDFEVDQHVGLFEAKISTEDELEIVTAIAQVKRIAGVWTYVELLLDFSLLLQAYEAYYSKHKKEDLQLPAFVRFNIKFKIAPRDGSVVYLDHFRFSPLVHNFEAKVYQLQGLTTALIQTDGLVYRTLFNHKHEEIVNFRNDGSLEKFTMKTNSGDFVPTLEKTLNHRQPCKINIEPENGFHENFDEISFHKRWTADDPKAWRRAPSQIFHGTSKKNSIRSLPRIVDKNSAAIYCFYSLYDETSSLHLVSASSRVTLEQKPWTSYHAILALQTNKRTVIEPLPATGELLLIVEGNRFAIFINGVLIFDEETKSCDLSNFSVEAKGRVLIENLLVMNRPQIELQYFNAWGEITQTIRVKDGKTVLVSEKLYDSLGRPAIFTQTTEITQAAEKPLLAYHQNFVKKSNVWSTGVLEGLVNDLNPKEKGFAYTRIDYDRSPLNQQLVVGMPSPDFSITSKFVKRRSNNSGIAFLENLFPSQDGFRQRVKTQPNGSQRVKIYDKNNNRVAKYVRVKGFDHLLSTYEFDKAKNLVKILPPKYHKIVGTSLKTEKWRPGEDHLTDEERRLQKALCTHLSYNSKGLLERKVTPDGTTTKFLYNSSNQKQFLITSGPNEEENQVIYFNYDSFGRIRETGFFKKSIPIHDLLQYLDFTDIPHSQPFQKIFYSDSHKDPVMRGRLRRFMTHHGDEPVIEELHYDAEQNVSKRRVLFVPEMTVGKASAGIEKYYKAGRLHTLVYPSFEDKEPMFVVHSYNKLGQLVALGSPDDETKYAKFTYNQNGQLETEEYQPSTGSFKRTFSYNSPGFLEKISDQFLTEKLFYTEKGYGQSGFGDGVIMSTEFEASWWENADDRMFQVKSSDFPDSKNAHPCVDALKRSGHLSISGTPQKVFLPNSETSLPVFCGGEFGNQLAQNIAMKQPPKIYGHNFAYGSHKDMLKAKYFTNERVTSQPLTIHSFSDQIPKLSEKESESIFNLLSEHKFIVTAFSNNPDGVVGRKRRSFLRDTKLADELKKISTAEKDFTIYQQAISKAVIEAFGRRNVISMSDFIDFFWQWNDLKSRTADLPDFQSAQRLYMMLYEKELFSTGANTNFLDENFTEILKNYSSSLPEIVRVLKQHSDNELGTHAFDVNSLEIDENGNHKKFYNGFHRYTLDYEGSSNKITYVNVNKFLSSKSEKFEVKHDIHGNVVKALHKNISKISYHPTSQRTTSIELTDGRKLRFQYDAQGKRLLKSVFAANDELVEETFYLRDENGRVLMDRKTIFVSKEFPPETVVTSYLYGPRGLMGFFRNSEFYSVTTDHVGSVRLVTRNGKVAVAYDYMPYGELMRSFVHDPMAQINYRFSGHEWDEETNLYNIHARLYDPSIGRFFQPDPQMQYFSPYKYAGNSPVSMIDPNGESSVFIAAIVAGVYAYFGGAAYNDQWNLAEWNFWYALPSILNSAGNGATIPLTLAPLKLPFTSFGMAALIAVGATGFYFSAAKEIGSFNVFEWKNWASPKTWNEALIGFAVGFAIPGNFLQNKDLVMTKFQGKYLKRFNAFSVGAGFLGMFLAGAEVNDDEYKFWLWGLDGPKTYAAMFGAFASAIQYPRNFEQYRRGFMKLYQKKEKLLHLRPVTKNSLKLIFSIVMGYSMGMAANGEWKNTYSTYQGVLNGVFFGKDLLNLYKIQEKSKKALLYEKFISKTMKLYTSRYFTAWNEYVLDEFFASNGQELNSNEHISRRSFNFHTLIELNDLVHQEEVSDSIVVNFPNSFCDVSNRRRKRHQLQNFGECRLALKESELSEKFLQDGEEFRNAFQALFRSTAGDEIKDPDFFSNLLAGSLAPLFKKAENSIQLQKQNFNFGCEEKKSGTCQLVFATTFMITDKEKGEGRVKLKMIAVDPIPPKGVQEFNHDDYVNKLKKSVVLQKNLQAFKKNEMQVELIRINGKKDSVLIEEFSVEPTELSDGSTTKFLEMTGNNDNLDQYLEKFLENPSSLFGQGAIEQFFKSLLTNYKLNQKALGLKKPEAGIHAFFQGTFTMNFKANFDVRIEKISGLEFPDMIFLSLKAAKKTKNWASIPIVIEDTKNQARFASSAPKIMHQVVQKTLADKVIVVEVNAVLETVITRFQSTYTSSGLTQQLFQIVDSESAIEAEIESLYYFTENYAEKQQNYMRCLIFGQTASRSDIKSLYVYPATDHEAKVLLQNPKGAWILLRILEEEQSSIIFGTKMPKAVSKMRQVDIVLNQGPQNSFKTFFKRAKAHSEETEIFYGSDSDFTKLKKPLALESIFVKAKPIDEARTTYEFMLELTEVMKPFKSYINSKDEFLAFVHGIFLSDPKAFASKNKALKVLARKDFSEKNNADLIILVFDTSEKAHQKVSEDFVIRMDLNYLPQGQDKFHGKNLKNANDNLSEPINFESVTDRESVVLVKAVYIKDTESVKFRLAEVPVRYSLEKLSDFSRKIYTDKETPEKIEEKTEEEKSIEDSNQSSEEILTGELDGKKNPHHNYLPKNRKREIPMNFSASDDNFDVPTLALDSVATSGSSHLKFWPKQVLSNFGAFIAKSAIFLFEKSSILERYESYAIPMMRSPSEKSKPKPKTNDDHSFMQMGDQWLSSVDLNGNLTWATLLARKFISKRSISHSNHREIPKVELYLLSVEIVEVFTESFVNEAVELGLEENAREALDNIDLSLLTREIYQKTQTSDWDSIPRLLLATLNISISKEKIFNLTTQNQLKIVESINQKINELLQQSFDMNNSSNIYDTQADRPTLDCIPEVKQGMIPEFIKKIH